MAGAAGDRQYGPSEKRQAESTQYGVEHCQFDGTQRQAYCR